MSAETLNTNETPKPELDVNGKAKEFNALSDFENPSVIKTAKDMLNLVKETLDKNVKKMDWTKINTYIAANKEFQKAIEAKQKTYQEAKTTNTNTIKTIESIKDLMNVIQDIQKSIDKKVIKDLSDIKEKADKTKSEMIKNFSKMDQAGLDVYKRTLDWYTKNLANYKDNTNTVNEYTNTENIVDNIQKIIDLTKLDDKITKDRLLELQTFLANSDFTEVEKKSFNAIINNLLPTAEKWATEKNAEKNTLETILSKEPTLEVAKELFETNESAWNALMATGDTLQLTTKTQNANFKKLMESYVKIAYNDATGITYSRLKYPITGEYYIQAQTANGKVVNIKFGKTSDILYQAQADNTNVDWSRENYDAKPTVAFKDEPIDFTNKTLNTLWAAKSIHDVIDMTKAPKKIQITRKNWTTKVDCTLKEGYTDGTITAKTNTYITSDNKIVKLEGWDKIEGVATTIWEDITSLDGIWSYRQLEKIINKQADKIDFLKRAFQEGILNAIDTNAHGWLDQSTKKNWYYKVIIEQIVSTKDTWLIDAYLGNIVVDGKINVKYLWTDNKNQLANLAILQKSWISAESENGKTIAKISAQLLKDADPKTIKDQLSSLMDAFGPMLFSVLKLLGFSKNRLIKLFGAERIEKLYKKEYGLTPEQIAAVKTISENSSFEKTSTSKSILETGWELETEFESKKTEYIKLIKTAPNYTFLNINVFKTWLTEFDKDKNINDVVTITTNSKTGKSSITEIKDTKAFEWAMKSILDNDTTWTKIATANASIQTDSIENKVKTWYNAQWLKLGENSEASSYKIKGQQDIARFLTASLFSNKDLADVMTVNRLNDGTIRTKTDATETKKPEEILSFIGGETLVKNNIVTVEGWKKKINEIIDTNSATAPTKIEITTAKGITTEATLVTLTDKTKTYVPTTNASKTNLTINDRIQFVAWDKISLPEKTKTDEEKTISEKLVEVETEIKKVTNNKYEKFDISSYTGVTPPTEQQAAYERNILKPIKELCEIQSDVTKVNDKYYSDFEKDLERKTLDNTKTLELKDYAPHLKNMLIMMWWSANTYKDITANMIEWTVYTAWTEKNEVIMTRKDWTKLWTLKFAYEEAAADKTRRLKPTWTAENVA